MVQLDMLRLAVSHEVGKVTILFLGNTELLRHRLEHVMGTLAVAATELHETQQQQGFLRGANLSVKRRADGVDRVLGIQVVGHLIGHAHITIQVEIEVDVTDTEMTT